MARKKGDDSKGGGSPAWMGTYSDLVTLLLCFFILLFSMSNVDKQKFEQTVESLQKSFSLFKNSGSEKIVGNGRSEEEPEENKNDETKEENISKEEQEKEEKAKEIAESIIKSLNEEGYASDILVSYTSNYVELSIAGEILFDSGDARLKGGDSVLAAINKIMVAKNYTKYMLNIEGHTDNVPIQTAKYPNNWYLSAARAIAVGEYLVENFQYDPARIVCTGYGEYKPVGDNSTPEGRERNRRVGFKILMD